VSFELWENIADDLNIDYEIVFYNQSSMNKIISDIEKGVIDVSIGSQTINSDRLAKIEFSQPFYITKLGIATNADTEAWYSFLSAILSADFLGILLLLALVLALLGSSIWLAERNSNNDFRKGPGGIWDGAYFMAVVMTTVGFGDKSTKTTLGKAITVVWMFAALGITGIFISSLSSSMTVNKMESGIEHLSDLRKMKVASISNTTSDLFLKNNEIKHYKYGNVLEGLIDIEKDELDVFVYDLPILQYLIQEEGLEGSVIISEKKYDTQYYGFGMKKGNNKLREDVNKLILRYIKSDDWENTLFKYNLDNN